jgi:hypothetical protein
MEQLVLLLVDILQAAVAVEILLHSLAESAMADQGEAVQVHLPILQLVLHLEQQIQVAVAVAVILVLQEAMAVLVL